MSQNDINSCLIVLGYLLFFVHVTVVRYRFNHMIVQIDHILQRRYSDSVHDFEEVQHLWEEKIQHAAEVPIKGNLVPNWNPHGSGEGKMP